MRACMNRVNEFLDKHVLPWPVRFLTFRFVIIESQGEVGYGRRDA